MKWFLLLTAGCLLAGCASKPPADAQAARSKNTAAPVHRTQTNQVPTITLASGMTGKVARVNGDKRFAVLTFPIGQVPASNQVMHVFRGDIKVGELRVTGPQRQNNTVADITAGQVAEGDEVRMPQS